MTAIPTAIIDLAICGSFVNPLSLLEKGNISGIASLLPLCSVELVAVPAAGVAGGVVGAVPAVCVDLRVA